MKPLNISDKETMILALQEEVRRSDEARYDHRLHAILLVARGMTCPEAAKFLGDSTRAVQYWVHRFEEDGLAGLADAERPGRPRRLTEYQLNEIDHALRQPPVDYGLNTSTWDGKTLSTFIKNQFDVDLGVRQCQRLFRQLGFRLRKHGAVISKADSAQQADYKKNCKK